MYKMFFCFLFLAPFITAAQQSDSSAKTTDSVVSDSIGIESEYPGGPTGWRNFLMNNMKYPVKAMKKNIQGTVIVQFIVDANGKVTDIELIEGPVLLGEEGVRLIKASGKWIPATINGKPVKSYKKQPFTFKLEKG